MIAEILIEQVYCLTVEAKALADYLHEESQKRFTLGATGYGTERVTGNPSQSAPFENPTISYVDKYLKINDQLNRYRKSFDFFKQLVSLIGNERERDLLVKRSLEGKDWKNIARELQITERHVFNIRNKAINSLQAVLDEQEKG